MEEESVSPRPSVLKNIHNDSASINSRSARSHMRSHTLVMLRGRSTRNPQHEVGGFELDDDDTNEYPQSLQVMRTLQILQTYIYQGREMPVRMKFGFSYRLCSSHPWPLHVHQVFPDRRTSMRNKTDHLKQDYPSSPAFSYKPAKRASELTSEKKVS